MWYSNLCLQCQANRQKGFSFHSSFQAKEISLEDMRRTTKKGKNIPSYWGLPILTYKSACEFN